MKCIFCGHQIKTNDKECPFCKQAVKPSYQKQKINGFVCWGIGILIIILSVVLMNEFEGIWGVLTFGLLLALSIIFICMPIALFMDYPASKKVKAKYEEIKKRLPEATERSKEVDPQIAENNVSAAYTSKLVIHSEDLIELKKLLDLGIITQEEFDRKKKQLLNL